MFTKVLMNIKLIGVVVAGAVMALLYALLQKSEKEKAEIITKVQTKKNDIQIKAAKAAIKGAAKEQAAVVKPVDTKNRDHFG